jgi:hypothetical protein
VHLNCTSINQYQCTAGSKALLGTIHEPFNDRKRAADERRRCISGDVDEASDNMARVHLTVLVSHPVFRHRSAGRFGD